MSDIDRKECFRRIASRFALSSDIFDDFDHYVYLLRKWQDAQNLVSRETLNNVWSRHILDSAELVDVNEKNGTWLDLGSGAGLPGLVVAVLNKHLNHSKGIILVESNGRKVAFLRNVIRDLGLPARVINSRIESVAQKDLESIDFISARAVASLTKLFDYSTQFVDAGAECFFHKGRDINGEIEEAANTWSFDLVKYKSSLLPESEGVIVNVRALKKIR